MKTYKLIKPIKLPYINEDGYGEEDKYATAPKGSLWHIGDNTDYEVYLENNLGDWLGMSKETFKEYFVEVKE